MGAEEAKTPEGGGTRTRWWAGKVGDHPERRPAFRALNSAILQVHPRNLDLIPNLGHPRAGHSAGQGPATEGKIAEALSQVQHPAQGRARGGKAHGHAVALAHSPSRTGTDIYSQHSVLIRTIQHPNL